MTRSREFISIFRLILSIGRAGYVAPLAPFTGNGLTPRPTVAAAPGLLTGNPLQVSYVPGKSYVYMADMGAGNCWW